MNELYGLRKTDLELSRHNVDVSSVHCSKENYYWVKESDEPSEFTILAT